jgi:hypothetical protein
MGVSLVYLSSTTHAVLLYVVEAFWTAVYDLSTPSGLFGKLKLLLEVSFNVLREPLGHTSFSSLHPSS